MTLNSQGVGRELSLETHTKESIYKSSWLLMTCKGRILTSNVSLQDRIDDAECQLMEPADTVNNTTVIMNKCNLYENLI